MVRFPDFLNLMANKVCVKVVKGMIEIIDMGIKIENHDGKLPVHR